MVKAVPDAGDLAGVEQRVLGVPGDGRGHELPALAVADGLGEVDVEAGVGTVVTHVAVGREVLVKAQNKVAIKRGRGGRGGAGRAGGGSGVAGGCGRAAGGKAKGTRDSQSGGDELAAVERGVGHGYSHLRCVTREVTFDALVRWSTGVQNSHDMAHVQHFQLPCILCLTIECATADAIEKNRTDNSDHRSRNVDILLYCA